MSDKKIFPNERPEDVNEVLTDLLSDIGYIQFIIRSISDFKESPTVIYSVNSEHFKKFLERIIKPLELLSGYITEELEPEIEALSGDLTESYDTNKELHRENQRLKTENEYLRDDKFRVVMECTERDKEIKKLREKLKRMSDANHSLYNRLENSEKMLKAAVSKIDDLEYAKNKENKNSLYGMCAKYVIRLNPVNDGSNFCGNCRYCVQLMTGEYACRMPIPDRIIDPDDSSCQYFKQPYDTRTDQEVCAECDKKDTEHCKKCPLFPF